jgi:hypothetical protein
VGDPGSGNLLVQGDNWEARALLDEIRASSRRRRSMLRDPERHLSGILERWKVP